MNLLDDEVFAVILAVIIAASILSIAQILRPEAVESFSAISILNENCKIGDYPDKVLNGENITLCVFIDNHMGYPAYFQVRYKIGDNETLPTNTTPSPQPTIMVFEVLLDNKANKTFKINIPVNVSEELVGSRVALIFELWMYDIDSNEWVYTGRWNHLYIRVLEVPLGG